MGKYTLSAGLVLVVTSLVGRAQQPRPGLDPVALQVLSVKQKLFNPDPNVRREAALAAGQIARSLRSMASLLGDKLEDEDPAVRQAAVSALTTLGSLAWDAVPQLTKALDSKEDDFRAAAADALAHIGPAAKEALPALLRLVRDKNPRVRYAVQGALAPAGLPTKQLVPILTEAINDPYEGGPRGGGAIGIGAMSILASLGPAAKEAVPTLRQVAASGDKRAHWALRALAKIAPDEKTLALLHKLLNDPQVGVRLSALGALEQMGPAARPAMPDLLKAFQAEGVANAKDAYHLKLMVLITFERMGPAAQEAVPLLLKEMEAGDKQLSPRAFLALKVIAPGDARLLAALTAALKSADGRTRFEAVKRLGELGPAARPAVPALVEVLQAEVATALQGNRNTALSPFVLKVLQNMGPAAQAAVPALRELAVSRNRPVRLGAQAALKKIEEGD